MMSKIRAWVGSKRRMILIVTAGLTLVAGVSVTVPSLAAEAPGHFGCTVDDSPPGLRKVCIRKEGTKAWAVGYADPGAYQSATVELWALVPKDCVWDGARYVNCKPDPKRVSYEKIDFTNREIGGRLWDSGGDWRAGRDILGVYELAACITTTTRTAIEVATVCTGWTPIKDWE